MAHMSRLEDAAMAKMRDRMLHSDLSGLLKCKQEIESQCKGGNEHMEYQTSLLRDVFAYSIVHWFSMMDCSAFGGFVAAHVSGKVWKDIDILTPIDFLKGDCNKIIGRLVKYIRFVFGISARSIKVEPVQHKNYAKHATLSLVVNELKFQLSIDMVDARITSPFVPVTLGRCLYLADRCITKRRIQHVDIMLSSWECEDIISLLKDGKDVGLCMQCKNQPIQSQRAYSEYFWSRIKKIRSTGYDVCDFLGEKPVS